MLTLTKQDFLEGKSSQAFVLAGQSSSEFALMAYPFSVPRIGGGEQMGIPSGAKALSILLDLCTG